MEVSKPISVPRGSSGPMWNHLAGRVISILHGLTRTRVKLMTEDAVILTVRCPSEKFKQTSLRIGQHVIAQVNAHDVLLGTVGRWPGKERWNRWSGRIVLVNPRDSAPLITVKLQGKGCTLVSTGPVIGQPSRPEVWEPVSIVIDPENVILTPHRRATQDTCIATSAHTRARARLAQSACRDCTKE